MKLLSVLTVCAALCIAVTQASSLARAEEETDQASVQELLKMLAEAEAQDDIDEEALAGLLATGKLSEKKKAKAEGIGATLLGVGASYLIRRIRFRGW